jgi:hypothetical protein
LLGTKGYVDVDVDVDDDSNQERVKLSNNQTPDSTILRSETK